MKAFNGYKPEENKGNKLPAGGYVCRVIDAEVEEYSDKNTGNKFEKLKIIFDIDEGPYYRFFAQQLAENGNAYAKYKGNYRVSVPDEGSQYFTSQKKTFNGLMWVFENSNAGFTWDWDEKKLKDKLFGLIFGDKEWEFNGKTGWTAQPSSP